MRNAVLNEELECVQGMSAKIHVEPGSTPQFCKVRPVPFALCGRVERELDRLHKSGVIEPVKFAEWAAPIVPVIKSDGSVRICGDYKVTVNRVAKVDSYALLCIDDLFASLVGGKRFCRECLHQRLAATARAGPQFKHRFIMAYKDQPLNTKLATACTYTKTCLAKVTGMQVNKYTKNCDIRTCYEQYPPCQTTEHMLLNSTP